MAVSRHDAGSVVSNRRVEARQCRPSASYEALLPAIANAKVVLAPTRLPAVPTTLTGDDRIKSKLSLRNREPAEETTETILEMMRTLAYKYPSIPPPTYRQHLLRIRREVDFLIWETERGRKWPSKPPPKKPEHNPFSYWRRIPEDRTGIGRLVSRAGSSQEGLLTDPVEGDTERNTGNTSARVKIADSSSSDSVIGKLEIDHGSPERTTNRRLPVSNFAQRPSLKESSTYNLEKMEHEDLLIPPRPPKLPMNPYVDQVGAARAGSPAFDDVCHPSSRPCVE